MARPQKAKEIIVVVKASPTYSATNANGGVPRLRLTGEITGFLEFKDDEGNHLIVQPLAADATTEGMHRVVDGSPALLAMFTEKQVES